MKQDIDAILKPLMERIAKLEKDVSPMAGKSPAPLVITNDKPHSLEIDRGKDGKIGWKLKAYGNSLKECVAESKTIMIDLAEIDGRGFQDAAVIKGGLPRQPYTAGQGGAR